VSSYVRSRGMPRRSQPAAARRGPMLLAVGGVIGVVILAAATALLLASPAPPALAEPAARQLTVTGPPLEPIPASGADPAVGQVIPTLGGRGLDGSRVSIGPDRGAQAIVVLAHWCPHCQAEVPVLVDWLARNDPAAGLSVVALSTSIDPVRPNYPPSAWLAREGWPQPTLVDDAGSSGLAALGITTFPSFVFVNADGTVAARMTGEIGADAFASALEAIAP
jgi:cytochrome c biogenesis protein CcmG, thiol:disulfide interchange protein DsbE